MKNPKTLGIIQVTFAAFLWGTIGLFVRNLNTLGVPSTAIVAIRILIAFVGLSLFWVLVKKRLPKINRQDIPLLIVYSLIGVVALNFLYFSAISLIPIALAAILLYLAPVLVLPLSFFFLKEKITFIKIMSALIVFAGIVMVVNLKGVDQLSGLGLIYGLLGAVSYALYSVLGKRIMEKNDSLDVVTYSFGIGGAGLYLLALIRSEANFIYPTSAWIWLIILGLIPTLLGFIIFNSGLRKIKASEASILATIEPVTAAVLGGILLSEKLLPIQIIGIIIVVTGIAMSNIKSKSKYIVL